MNQCLATEERNETCSKEDGSYCGTRGLQTIAIEVDGVRVVECKVSR